MAKKTKILLVCLVLASGVVLAYWPHIGYPFPLIGDEYGHIALGKYAAEEYVLPLQNPYLPAATSYANFETGFDLLLAALFTIIPGEPVLYYQFFPTIFLIINSLLLFYLVTLWSKNYYDERGAKWELAHTSSERPLLASLRGRSGRQSSSEARSPIKGFNTPYWAALFAVFFFGTIKSTPALLAHQYFIPLTLGITLLLLSFILFHKWTQQRSNKYIFFLFLSLVALAFSYPPAFFFFVGVMLFYILSTDHALHEFFHTTKRKFLQYFSSISVFLAIVFVAALFFLNVLDEIVFFPEWNVVQIYLSPVSFFGIIPSALAALGLWTVAVSKDKTSKIILYWFLFSIVALYLINIFDISILIPIARLFVFYLIGISILAGLGMATLFRLARQHTFKKQQVFFVFAALAVLPAIHYYIVFERPLEHHPILTQENYAALKFLSKAHPDQGIIIADNATSLGVYPVTGKYVASLLNSNIGGGNPDISQVFLTGDCQEKARNALVRLSNYFSGGLDFEALPLFLLSPIKQNCPVFFDLIYNNGVYVYALHPGANISATTVLAGNTLEGSDWVEYYNKNGNIKGKIKSTEETYTGSWRQDRGPGACFVFSYDQKTEVCLRISSRDDGIYFFHGDGTPLPERKAERFLGNQYEL